MYFIYILFRLTIFLRPSIQNLGFPTGSPLTDQKKDRMCRVQTSISSTVEPLWLPVFVCF